MNKIAVCGKGGSGKSVVTTLLAGGLRRRGMRVLVVDSDESNTGLYRMLGFDVAPEPLIDLMGGKQKVEETIIGQIGVGVSEAAIQLLEREISVADIPAQYIVERDGIRLVTVGKVLMALEGCACPMGIVSRSFLKQLHLETDETAVVDLEAGVEHFGRGVETGIDSILVVVEPSLDSLDIAERIGDLSNQMSIGDVWAVLNKVTSERIKGRLTDELVKRRVPVIGAIRFDQEVFESCLDGHPVSGRVANDDVEGILDSLLP